MLHFCIFVHSCLSGVEEIWNKNNISLTLKINEGMEYEKQEFVHYVLPDKISHLENLMNELLFGRCCGVSC